MGKRRKRKRRKKIRLVEERVGSHPDRIRLKVYDKIGLVRGAVAVKCPVVALDNGSVFIEAVVSTTYAR